MRLLKRILIILGRPFYYLILLIFSSLNFILKIKIKTLPALLIFGLLLLTAFWFFYYLPPANTLLTRKVEVSTKIYDRHGNLLYKIYKNENRSLISLEKIPQIVIEATLAAEDAEFYSHYGFSIRGISRAFIKNLRKGELSGGSTITQQLVKNALLTPEKTITRKVKELFLSFKIEAAFSKDQILEMYLNEVPYGGTAYGIKEAAKIHFNKEVGNLNLAEAALLAGLPKSPTKYSPFGQDPNSALERQREVLYLMRINKYITLDEEKTALNSRLSFAPQKVNILAPHFVMYVKSLLEEKYGRDSVESNGLEVLTTLDLPIQALAEKIVAEEMAKLRALKVTNAAVLVLSPQTGEMLAMVGSKDYFDTQAEGNVNVALSPRPPGSSIKVVNYAYALAHGYTAASLLSDSPITFNLRGQEPYSPQNYDGQYRGNLSLRSALAESRNIPAVKVLNSYGVEAMLKLGQKMGITTWDNPSRFGLSLTLGGGEVRLIDLAQIYAVLANYGQKTAINPFLKISDYKNRTIWEKKENKGEEIIDPRVAFLLTDILKDNLVRFPAFGSNSQLVIKGHPEVAVKTGTSNSLRDNLTLGYNQDYLVAVWVGNNDNSPMSHVASGVTGASPIWNKIMTELLKNEPSHEWQVPEGLVNLPICRYTGTLSCSGCTTNMEWFLKENTPKTACNPDYIEKLRQEKKTGGELVEPAARISN